VAKASNAAIGAIWPCLVALLVGLIVIATVPWISIEFH